tara:strand:+ start:278 stop:511 length:234 start_codon:yes stop_codon:yes gene_type:complete
MEIDVYTHTVIAIACLAGCYYWGRLLAKREILSEVVDTTLEKLEKEGFVRMEIDEDGDKSLVPISEIEIAIINGVKK